jgi:DNA-binding PucR family transcriptional regulator
MRTQARQAMLPSPPGHGRAELVERLRERRPEIERTLITRVYAIADPTEAADPTYAEGLRAAVGAAIDYGLAGIDRSQARAPQVPAALLTQARVAARNGVTLDTVLRRYFAGYTLFGDFLVGEMQEDESVSAATLKRILLTQAANFDRLVAAVTEEHARESEVRIDSTEQRRVDLVQRLLAGELVETSELAYDLEGWHLGIAATGRDSADAIRDLGKSLGRRVLLVRQDRDTTWAWLGGRRRIDLAELISNVESFASAQVTIALGEPGEGLNGWRLSHRQAAAALLVALRGTPDVVRYRDVALSAAMLQDDLLATSLRRLYLSPLGDERNGGATARETLRAYFAADRNISSAAAALAVHRDTVANPLRAIEARIGRSPDACAAELELALRLDELAEPAT